MSNRFRHAAACAVLVSLVGCAGNQATRPNWSEAAGADLVGSSTFGWDDRDGRPPVTILDNRIREAIRAELVAKGYVESIEAPDVLVHHEPIEQESVRQGSPVRIGIGIGTRSGNIGGSVGTSVDVGERDQVQQQLKISIRVTTPDERREAWVGTTAAIPAQPSADDVTGAVAGVMKGFPAQEAAGR